MNFPFHFVAVWIMNCAEMIVHLFFSVKDLPALRTHILSRPGFRSAFTFNYLSQFFTS
jgi:hypothetical protein